MSTISKFFKEKLLTLPKAVAAGGKILLLKTGIGEMNPGFTFWIEVVEGNRLGLYGV
jgi:hypothetical protein